MTLIFQNGTVWWRVWGLMLWCKDTTKYWLNNPHAAEACHSSIACLGPVATHEALHDKIADAPKDEEHPPSAAQALQPIYNPPVGP